MTAYTIAALVPAHNEEDGLGDTLESLLRQTVPFDQIVVVDDGSTDRTAEIARSYGVEVVAPPTNTGSKAKAQNYGLGFVTTDLVLPVDADTVLADNYVETIVPTFEDSEVEIAAGCVLSRFDDSTWEKGRKIEYMVGFHWARPIQNLANSPIVCSGCCSVFRVATLRDLFGGFPIRSVAEDMDYTWSLQIAGKRAVYVGDAVAYAADPNTLGFLRKQMWRWMAGFFQMIRLHYVDLWRHKKMLALWATIAIFELLFQPFWYLAPLWAPLAFDLNPWTFTAVWFAMETLVVIPPLAYASWRRDIPFWRALAMIPNTYLNKAVNMYYSWKGFLVELIGVPLGLTKGLTEFEKGSRIVATAA